MPPSEAKTRHGPPRRITVLHNYYQQAGGEDEVFRAEVELLRSRGHEVVDYTVDNKAITGTNPVGLARDTVWNSGTYRALRSHFRATRPEIAHFHNTFPLISPAAYYAAQAEGVAVVQTLHNYRLCCPNALFFRDGHVCEECLGRRFAWPGVIHACYRHNRSASGVVAAMVAVHRVRRTWQDRVDAYVALSAFARTKFIAGGLPADRIHVKPNFLGLDPGPGDHESGFALFVGRLSPEKGLSTLLKAWAIAGGGRTLKIVGTGPLETLAAERQPGVEWLGWQPRQRVLELMSHGAFLVLPSECYENFPLTLVEAYATGMPVIGSSGGSIAELIEDHRTGRLFPAGDAAGLAEVLTWAAHRRDEVRACGQRARGTFLSKYTAGANYARLLEVYDRAAGAAAHQ